jgi:hypothetical protein
MEYNIYCDESCHLENDRQKAMVFGAVWCEKAKVKAFSKQLRALKALHKLAPDFELKWTKVSSGKIKYYRDILLFFLDEDGLNFRALIVPDKSVLAHARYGQTHDEWYYKMYFDMLKVIIAPDANYNIYIDIKDTQGGRKAKKLHEVLANSNYDYRKEIIRKVQLVHSSEIELLQLTDLLIGAISYINRGLHNSAAKLSLIDTIKKRTGYSLVRTTLLKEEKFNLFQWHTGIGRNNGR